MYLSIKTWQHVHFCAKIQTTTKLINCNDFCKKNSYDHLQNTSDTKGILIQNAKAKKKSLIKTRHQVNC